MFLQDKKAQTSLEFLIILLIVMVIAITVVASLTSTFDINIAMHKTKNLTLKYIAGYNHSYSINTINYVFDNDNLDLVVYLNKGLETNCPVVPDDYNYTALTNGLLDRTKFDVINISLECV
ncbi:MAG: hypothetical protein PHX47_02420 [Candidatus ainarchaeum sp.]|nr:hypothetical protein [Candidatus ainarchaeum sp.]